MRVPPRRGNRLQRGVIYGKELQRQLRRQAVEAGWRAGAAGRLAERGRRRRGGGVCGGVRARRRHRRRGGHCGRARAAAAAAAAAGQLGVTAGGGALPLLRQAAAVGGDEVAQAASKGLFRLLVKRGHAL